MPNCKEIDTKRKLQDQLEDMGNQKSEKPCCCNNSVKSKEESRNNNSRHNRCRAGKNSTTDNYYERANTDEYFCNCHQDDEYER